MQNFFATKRGKRKKKKKRFLLMQQKNKAETETKKFLPKTVIGIDTPTTKPTPQIPGIVPIESLASHISPKGADQTSLGSKNPGELNPMPKTPASKHAKPRLLANPSDPTATDGKGAGFKNASATGSHNSAKVWSATGGSQSPASANRPRKAFPSQQERDLERQKRARSFYDNHNTRGSRNGSRRTNSASHSSARPHLGSNLQKARTKFENKFRRRDRSRNDRAGGRNSNFSQRARPTDASGSIYEGNQLSAPRGDRSSRKRPTVASAPSTSNFSAMKSTSVPASPASETAPKAVRADDKSGAKLESVSAPEARLAEGAVEAGKNPNERVSTGQTHRANTEPCPKGKKAPARSDVVVAAHSSWSQTQTFVPHVHGMSATLPHSPEDSAAYVQLLLWSLEGSALLKGMDYKRQQEFLTQWVSCHQRRARLVKLAASPAVGGRPRQSVVAGAVASPCRLLLPRRDALPGSDCAGDALAATLVSGCAFAPQMLTPARDAEQQDVQHCRTSLFGRLLNDALVRGSTVLITYLRTDQSLQLHRECGFEACGHLRGTTIPLNDISTALLRDADKAQEADAAVVAREKSAHAALFVRPATTADNDAIEHVRVVYTGSHAAALRIELPKQFWGSEVHRGGNGTAVYDMPLPSDVKASTSEPISRYVVCCRHEGVVKGYLFFYRKRRDMHIVDMAATSTRAWRAVAHFLQAQTCASIERVSWVGGAGHALQTLLSLHPFERRTVGDAPSFAAGGGLHVGNRSNPWGTSNPWAHGHQSGDALWRSHAGAGRSDGGAATSRCCALRVVNAMQAFAQFRYPTLIPEVVLVARVVGDRQLSHTNQTLRIVVSAGRAQVETAPHASLGGSGRTAFAPHLVVHIRGVALLLYGGGIAGAGAVPVKQIVARGLMTLTAGTHVANQRVLAQLNYLFR